MNAGWLLYVAISLQQKRLALDFDYIALIKSNESGACSSGFPLSDTVQ